jgi:uncharacterized membrane protein (DUF485 family)
MKRTVLVFGLISGAIMASMMFATLPFMVAIGDKGMIVGYTIMVLSFMLVFFGIRSYRENVNGGTITFGRAFGVGILITVIASVLYVVGWEIIYFGVPGFAAKFNTMYESHIRNSGGSPESIRAQLEQFKSFQTWYANPLINSAVTFLEPLPVGLIMTFVSALILRKRQRQHPGGNPIPAAS